LVVLFRLSFLLVVGHIWLNGKVPSKTSQKEKVVYASNTVE
jgi:hypothetical protein